METLNRFKNIQIEIELYVVFVPGSCTLKDLMAGVDQTIPNLETQHVCYIDYVCKSLS